MEWLADFGRAFVEAFGGEHFVATFLTLTYAFFAWDNSRLCLKETKALKKTLAEIRRDQRANDPSGKLRGN